MAGLTIVAIVFSVFVAQDIAVPCYISGSTPAYGQTSQHRALPAAWRSSRAGQYRSDAADARPTGISSDILPIPVFPADLIPEFPADPIPEFPAATPVYDLSAYNRLPGDSLLVSPFIAAPVAVPPDPPVRHDASPVPPDTYEPTFDRLGLVDLQLLSILLSNPGLFYSSSSSSSAPPIAADPPAAVPVPVAVPPASPDPAPTAAVPGPGEPIAATPGTATPNAPATGSTGPPPVVPDSAAPVVPDSAAPVVPDPAEPVVPDSAAPVADTTVGSPLGQITEPSEMASTTRPVNASSVAPIPQ